jgi:hypothetical protein
MATANLTQVFIQGAIEGYVDLIAPLTAFSYNVEQNSATLNDQVIVPFCSVTSASVAFTYANGYSTSQDNGIVNGKTVTLNNLLYQPIRLTDQDMLKLSPEVVARLGHQAGAKLATDVISASFASVLTLTNFAQTGSADAPQYTSSLNALANLDKLANDKKWPDGNRFIVAGTQLWSNVMSNTSVNQFINYGDPSVVKNAKLPSIMGFTPFKVTVPLTSYQTGSCAGFAATPNAMVFAQGYHAPGPDASNIVEAIKAVDDRTGLVIGYRRFYDPYKATTVQIIESLSGVAVADPNALVHIRTVQGSN